MRAIRGGDRTEDDEKRTNGNGQNETETGPDGGTTKTDKQTRKRG